MDFWDQIKAFQGQTLKTVQQGKEFDVLVVEDNRVIIKPHSSREKKRISKQSIESSYQALVNSGALTIKMTKAFSEHHPVYVIALISRFPNIKIEKWPMVKLILQS